MAITPEMMAKCGSEHGHQCALFVWAALKEQQDRLPELDLMFAIPNGGARDSDQKVAAKRGGELKAEGVKPGVLDICLPVARGGWHGLFIEMKVKPNKPSDEQLMFATKVNKQGYQIALCYSWLEAVAALETYLALPQ